MIKSQDWDNQSQGRELTRRFDNYSHIMRLSLSTILQAIGLLAVIYLCLHIAILRKSSSIESTANKEKYRKLEQLTNHIQTLHLEIVNLEKTFDKVSYRFAFPHTESNRAKPRALPAKVDTSLHPEVYLSLLKEKAVNISLNSSNIYVNRTIDHRIGYNYGRYLHNISDASLERWHSSLRLSLNCLSNLAAGIFLYHTRKAAGTSIRDYLKGFVVRRRGVQYLETEGISLNNTLLHLPAFMNVISLRHPIHRIESLYWYEHVSYCLLMKRNPKLLYSFEEYINAWRDGAEWKNFFNQKNPGSVYVEVENYYIKMLTGWHGPQPVNRSDLNRAKALLEDFQVILISEWIKNPKAPANRDPQIEKLSALQVEMMNSFFPISTTFSSQRKVEGNKSLKQNATIYQILIPNRVSYSCSAPSSILDSQRMSL
jgi:hypothetical protein